MSMSVGVCVCVCVCERERERMKKKSLTRNIQQERKGGSKSFLDILSEGVFQEWSARYQISYGGTFD